MGRLLQREIALKRYIGDYSLKNDMDFDTLLKGLEERGFVNTAGISGSGNCHKDEKHYVLLTDGLVIYSSIPHRNSVKYFPNELECIWTLEKWWNEKDELSMMLCLRPDDKVFTFEELEVAMKLIDEQRKYGK
jgi:hypothetical protein